MSTAAATDPTTSCIEPGTRVQRSFAVKREAINLELRTVELAFASDAPYERFWGVEVLDVAPTAMRTERIGNGRAPLLMDHDMRDQVGVVASVQIGTDQVARAVVRFGKSARADEIFADVVDGIRANVSVGYVIHKAVLIETGDDRDTYRVTDWEPYEVSIVSVPADHTVGVGRSDAPVIQRPAAIQAQPAARQFQPEPATMATEAPALNTNADAAAERLAERKHIAEMLAIGEQFAKFGGPDIAKKSIEAGETIDVLRTRVMNAITAAQDKPVAHLDMEAKDVKRFSVLKAIRAMADKDWRHAGLEREATEAICKRMGIEQPVHGGFYLPEDVQYAQRFQKRDLTVGTSSAGGYLVATQNMSFIEMLRARARALALGVTVMDGLVGNVTVPKQTAASTAYWLANEATAITESQQTFGQLALTPKVVGAYTELSRLLLQQSSPAAESLVMMDLAKVLALGIDLAIFEGSGASGQPTGISATGGIGSVTGTSIALAGIVEFQTDVATNNALTTGCAYATTPAVAGLLKQRQRFSSTDTPLWRGNVLDGEVEGFAATTSTQLTAASMIFGDFSQVVLAMWGVLEIAQNPYANFGAAITGIRAIQTCDVGVRQAGAFSRATSIT